MNADASPRAAHGPQAPAADWLTAHAWRLEEAPPGADSLAAADGRGGAPLLLLLDRRMPLPPGGQAPLVASLSAAERQHHQALRRSDDRQRFLLARAALRRLLGHWLELAPQAVPLVTGPRGKPDCPDGPQFNISHSGDLILLALHPRRPVGVDVERLRPELNWRAIARRVLTPAELTTIAGLPEPQQPQAFLASWCRLEARLKARGVGLAGLEQLRRATPGDATSPPSGPLPAHARPGGEPIAAAPRAEAIWNVAVPGGYRAAAALAPQPR